MSGFRLFLARTIFLRPETSHYCLLSHAGAFATFHIECGGSSVWHHLVFGVRIYYLIEPTDLNLELYESWVRQPNETRVFLPNIATRCYQHHVRAGETFFIPAGWIYATLSESAVLGFGGRFIALPLTAMSLRVAEMEDRLCIKPDRLYPSYTPLLWYAAQQLGSGAATLFASTPTCLENCASLVMALRRFLSDPLHSLAVPIDIQPVAVLAALQRLLPEGMLQRTRQPETLKVKVKLPAIAPPALSKKLKAAARPPLKTKIVLKPAIVQKMSLGLQKACTELASSSSSEEERGNQETFLPRGGAEQMDADYHFSSEEELEASQHNKSADVAWHPGGPRKASRQAAKKRRVSGGSQQLLVAVPLTASGVPSVPVQAHLKRTKQQPATSKGRLLQKLKQHSHNRNHKF